MTTRRISSVTIYNAGVTENESILGYTCNSWCELELSDGESFI